MIPKTPSQPGQITPDNQQNDNQPANSNIPANPDPTSEIPTTQNTTQASVQETLAQPATEYVKWGSPKSQFYNFCSRISIIDLVCGASYARMFELFSQDHN